MYNNESEIPLETSSLNSLLLDSIPSAAMLISKQHIIIAANRQALNKGAVIGRQCWKSFGTANYLNIHSDESIKNPRPCSFCQATKLFRTGTEQNAYKVESHGKYYDIVWKPVNQDCYLHFCTNVTASVEHEKEISEMQYQHAQFIELLTSEGIWVIGEDGRTLFGNSVMASLLGVPQNELSGKYICQFMTKRYESRLRKNIEASRTGKKSRDLYILKNKKQKRYALITISPIFDQNKEYISSVALVSDVTEQKIAEKKNLELIKKLKSAMKKIHVLKGMLPICSNCKKIRDDNNEWHHIEQFISKHSDAHFTHGMCPACIRKLYPKFAQRYEDSKI